MLIIPYIIIPIIYLIIKYFLSGIKYNEIFLNLFLQYMTGYHFYFIFWFINNLIIYTIFFEIFFLLFKKNNLLILQLLAIIIYLLKCIGALDKIFDNYSLNIRVIKNIGIMIPISVTGITLGFKQVLKNIFFYIIYFYFL